MSLTDETALALGYCNGRARAVRRRALAEHGKRQRCSRPEGGMSVLRHAWDAGRVEVRVMQSTELDATLDVWRAAGLARGRPGEGHRVAAARSMLEAPTGTTYVAVSPHVIGMTLIEPGGHEERRATDDPSCVQISMVFVHPSAQRTGVGTALLQHVVDVARARRFTGVQVWTGTDNPQAQRFYSRLGMVPTGRCALGMLSEQMQYQLVFAIGDGLIAGTRLSTRRMGPTLVGDCAHLDWCGRVDPATAIATDDQRQRSEEPGHTSRRCCFEARAAARIVRMASALRDET